MFKRNFMAVALMTASTSALALPYGFYDARSVGMGNVSVATGGITTAALSNPGMLAVNEGDDKFAILFPAIGVQAIDDGDVIDKIDEFQAQEDIIANNPGNPVVVAAARQEQVNILESLDGSSVILQGTPNAAFVYSGEDFTWGVTVRGNIVISGGLINVDTNILSPTATVTALEVVTTEIGIPMGTSASFGGMEVSFGVTPRLVQVDAYEYESSIDVADISDAQDQPKQDLGSFTTLDAGVTMNVLDTVRVGVVAKNLVEETKTTFIGRDINFDTHLRAGIAFDAGFMTIAADMDLDEVKPVHNENPSQMMAVGVEFDTFNVMQIRAGYQKNIASGVNEPDLLSLGLGFWLGFHLDVAVVAGEDSSLGAFAQTGFRF